MKKITTILMSILLTMCLSISVMAQTGCVIAAKEVMITQTGQVTVPVEIVDNKGFTNFGIALDYDKEQLELVSINVKDEEISYLCGEFAATNINWLDVDDEKSYGYITAASETEISDSGILFTVTFNTTDKFNENAIVTPIVKYMRNNSAVFNIFEDVNVTTQSGAVTLIAGGNDAEKIYGDIDGDGILTYKEVLNTLAAFREKKVFTEEQIAMTDIDGNGKLEYKEVITILKNFRKGEQGN